MTVAASAIINRARDVLIDVGATRWTDPELLRWLSDGQRTVVMAIPAASSKRATLALAAGTVQSIPADGYTLLTVERNNGAANGSTPGRVIRLVSRELVDNFNPDWHTATAKAVAQSYMFDPNVPKQFYVSPPNTGTGYADIVYSQMPAELTSTASTLTVDDIFQTPLVDYVLYRAFQKDSDYVVTTSVYSAVTLASSYLEAFKTAIGVSDQALVASNPNQGLTPPNLANRGSAK